MQKTTCLNTFIKSYKRKYEKTHMSRPSASSILWILVCNRAAHRSRWTDCPKISGTNLRALRILSIALPGGVHVELQLVTCGQGLSHPHLLRSIRQHYRLSYRLGCRLSTPRNASTFRVSTGHKFTPSPGWSCSLLHKTGRPEQTVSTLLR